jgi:hypothetical protein
VRTHEGLHTDGHNVFICRQKDADSADGKLTIDFGVQITRSFAGEGDVICTSTQAGRVATTLHVGPYDRLSEALVAIQGSCAEHGYAPAGVDSEVYGDWNDDPSSWKRGYSICCGSQQGHHIAPLGSGPSAAAGASMKRKPAACASRAVRQRAIATSNRAVHQRVSWPRASPTQWMTEQKGSEMS